MRGHRFLTLSRFFFVSILSLCAPLRGFAQSFAVSAQPGASIPLLGSEDLFSPGALAKLDMDWTASGKSSFLFNGNAEYLILPVNETAQDMWLVAAGLGAGVSWRPFDSFRFRFVGKGGYYRSFFDGDSGGSAFAAADAGVKWALSPSFALGLGLGFSCYLADPIPLLQTFDANLALTIYLGGKSDRPMVDIPSMELAPLFPVFRTYFDSHPIGKIRVKNGLRDRIESVKVTFFMKGYMDAPKTCAEIAAIDPGESRDVDLYALLNESILDITEETKVLGTVSIQYSIRGQAGAIEKIESVRVHDRNAMTWEDDRRAAAFVTAKDPTVLRLAKAVNAVVRDDPSPAASLNFRIALGLFEELGLYGIRYTVSPNGSYADAAADRFAVDFLQFPRQTLEYKGGDCSDISILYSALLESLGIEAAFITVPGHIFIAFDSGMGPDEAASAFSRPEDLIVLGNRAWVPVEITLVKSGFKAAWKEAGREWRENTATRAFYPLHEAWALYGPVGLPGAALDLGAIGGADFKERYDAALGEFVAREVSAREEGIKAEIALTDSSPASVNKLGVLYARYGLYAKAKAQFEVAAAAGGKSGAPALINLGNLAFLESDWKEARAKYEAASMADPASWSAFLGLAKAAYECEEYAVARENYQKAIAMKPSLASRYAFLAEKGDDNTRASSADERASVSWSEQ